jgi:hypothetical protein
MRLNTNEILIKKNRGNYRSNILNLLDWSGGHLFLTNQRLIFEPNFVNIRTEEEVIPLETIAVIEKKHSDFISSRLTLLLKNGSLAEFHVPKTQEWVKDIEKYAIQRGASLKIGEIPKQALPQKGFAWSAKVLVQLAALFICFCVLSYFLFSIL